MKASHPPCWWTCLLVFAGLFLLTLLLQYHNGAFSNDFGAHPDEAAHVVTGLMVRDYLAGPLWQGQHPMRFAEDYYENFPKVALGHYPPGFYAIEGLWLLPSRSKTAILLLMTTLTTLAAFIIWLTARQFLLPLNALLAATTFLLLPLVRTYTSIVMSDMLLLIFCLLATLSWGRFMDKKTVRWSLLFGLFAAAAILTKGSGLLLALVPPFTILLTRQFRLLTNWRLWLAPLPVIALALPWMLATRHITDEGMQHIPLTQFIPSALSYYAKAIPSTFGFIITILLALSFFLTKKNPSTTTTSVLLALLLSSLTLYLIVPAGLDTRYLLTAAPSIILLAFHTLQWLSERIPSQTPRKILPLSISLIAFALILIENGMPSKKVFSGSHPALQSLVSTAAQTSSPDKNRTTILISSDARGEGALIAEGCLYWPDTLSFRRASKVLAQSDWLGRDYQSTFETPAQLSTYLSKNIDFVIVDSGTPKQHLLPHHTLLQTTLTQNPTKNFTLTSEIHSNRKNTDSAHFSIFKNNSYHYGK